MCKIQRADEKLRAEAWTGHFSVKLHAALLPVNMKAQYVYNPDATG